MTEPVYEGNPRVSPEGKHKVNGRAIMGWATMQVTATGAKLRRSIELFMPNKIPAGCVAVPLIAGDELAPNVNGPAPELRPPVPLGPPTKTVNVVVTNSTEFNTDKLKELRRTCNINRNQGAKTIEIAYVLSCLES